MIENKKYRLGAIMFNKWLEKLDLQKNEIRSVSPTLHNNQLKLAQTPAIAKGKHHGKHFSIVAYPRHF